MNVVNWTQADMMRDIQQDYPEKVPRRYAESLLHFLHLKLSEKQPIAKALGTPTEKRRYYSDLAWSQLVFLHAYASGQIDEFARLVAEAHANGDH